MEGGESLSVADYFVIAGLDDNATLLQPPEYGDLAPIVDLKIVLPLENELCPDDWEYVKPSTALYAANFNWVNPAQVPVYIIFRRGYDLKPINEIDIQFIERKDRPKPDFTYIKTSIGGKPVSLNGHLNRPNKHVYIGYKRAMVSSFTDAVTVLHHTTSKREDMRQGFKSIRLHKSTFGLDTFMSYKLSKLHATTGVFKETLLDWFPKRDNPSFPLDVKNTPAFCLPMGVQVEWFKNRDVKPTPQFSSFVLTNEKGAKMYGSSLTFYELVIGASKIQSISENYPKHKDLFPYATKSICILSRWPSFFETFQKWLTELYEISVSGLALTIPIERMISNMLYDVPFPTLHRPTVEMSIRSKTLQFEQPLTTQIPTSGGTLTTLIQCLDPGHLLQVFFQLLLEENVLFISSSSTYLTATAEAFCSLLYPFKWMSPYIPLLPRLIGEELFADFELDCPVPFIIGMKREFLDMYHCPDRVTEVDLDNNTVRLPSSFMNPADYLPKHVINNLKNSLNGIYDLCDDKTNKVRKRAVELSIQEMFLKFQAHILKGYTDFLLPVKESKDKNFCNAENLFDIGNFVLSRDESQRPFYKKLLATQLFNCFIIARSFISDADETLEFFDGCIERLDENAPLLHKTDSNKGVTVVVQTEKMSKGLKPNKLYSYPVFILDQELFYDDLPEERSGQERSVISLRTKVEKQKMIKRAHAAKVRCNTMSWARCLLQHVYSVWYLYLPSLITVLEGGEEQREQLQNALQIIQTLKTERNTNLEEVCYRILISLSGFYDHPQIAMETFTHMQDLKMNISAVTYGHYHRAVLYNDTEPESNTALSNWRLLRLYIITAIAFKKFRRKSETAIIHTSSLESIQSSEKNTESPTGTGRFSSIGMSDSGIDLDHALSGLKTNSLEKRGSCESKESSASPPLPQIVTPHRPPINPHRTPKRGHTRSISDVSMLSVQNVHYRQLSDDAGSKSLSRLKSPRFKRSSLMGRTVVDPKGLSSGGSDNGSFKRPRNTMTASSSSYSVTSLEPDEDPDEYYKRDFANPSPIKFTLPPDYGDDLDPDSELKVKIWSSYPCSQCQLTIYDEQILAGWGFEESNLSTTCPYCDQPSVAQLSIEVQYRSLKAETEIMEPHEGQPRQHRESSITKSLPLDTNLIQISLEGEDDCVDSYESGNITFAMPEPIRRERKTTRSGSIIAAMNPRTTKKQEGEDRRERIEVRYLCPIVLRKEVECVCESDGPGEMVKEDLATSHSILFWNMVWWFCRENLPSSLPLNIPQAFRHLHPSNKLPQTVELSTEWSNTSHSLYNNFSELSRHKELPQCSQLWRVIEYFMQDDLQSAVNLMAVCRTEAHINLYRELLYLGCRYKNNFSPQQFDEEFTSCLARIPQISSDHLRKDDISLKQSEKHCRQMFSWLGLTI